jgi:hypothetical protein
MAETAEAYAQGATMEEAEKSVTKPLLNKFGPNVAADQDTVAKSRRADSSNFDSYVTDRVRSNIQKAYRVISGSTQ